MAGPLPWTRNGAEDGLVGILTLLQQRRPVSSDEEDQETFEAVGADAEKTYPIRAGEVKKGMVVMLKGFPCKVVEMTTSKTGKHGHAKANITGVDIFTGRKCQDISPTSHNMMAPFVTVKNYQLSDISEDGYVTLMTEEGDTREDLKLPTSDSADPELGKKIQDIFNEGSKDVYVVVTKAMDTESITSFRTAE